MANLDLSCPSQDVDSITASGTSLIGDVTLAGLNGVNLHVSGQTVIISGSGSGGASDHGALTGLLDDDHPQYGHLSQDESVTGVWNFSTSLTVSGFPVLTSASTLDDVETAIIGDGGFISVSSGTNTIRIQADAIVGTDGITVVSGTDRVTLTGFRSEFVSASGSLQTQISAIDSSVTLQDAYNNSPNGFIQTTGAAKPVTITGTGGGDALRVKAGDLKFDGDLLPAGNTSNIGTVGSGIATLYFSAADYYGYYYAYPEVFKIRMQTADEFGEATFGVALLGGGGQSSSRGGTWAFRMEDVNPATSNQNLLVFDVGVPSFLTTNDVTFLSNVGGAIGQSVFGFQFGLFDFIFDYSNSLGGNDFIIQNSNTSDDLYLRCGGGSTASQVRIEPISTLGEFTVNENGLAGFDTRIEGDNLTRLFFSDSSADRIGIGLTGSQLPTHTLSVTGTFNVRDAGSFNSTLSVGSTLSTADGTAAAPTHTFTNDSNTGIFRSASDIIGFSAGGTTRVTVSGANATTSGIGVAGNVTITNKLVAVTGTFTQGLTIGSSTTYISPTEISADTVRVNNLYVKGTSGFTGVITLYTAVGLLGLINIENTITIENGIIVSWLQV